MEVPGNLGQLVARLGELEQGPLEQVVVICFELDAPSVPEHLSVTPQKRLIGRGGGVLHRRPGVAEVDVQQVYLVRGKVVAEAAASPSIKNTLVSPISLHRSMAMTMASVPAPPPHTGPPGWAAAVWAVKRPLPHPSSSGAAAHRASFPARRPASAPVLDPQRRTDLHPCFQVLFLSHPHGILISLYNFKNQYTINYCKEQENRL